MIKDAILKVVEGNDLSEKEMIDAMELIMSGDVPEAQIGAFLTALKMKGEAVTEIYGGAKVLRDKALPINLGDYYTVDTCGTGGDAAETFNISTTVSIVTAAAGIKVLKHGNRSVSSKCGAADVLEALGIRIDLVPEEIKACVDAVGIGFLFAMKFHSAMRFVGPTRKALGYRTIFNILGPLANPAAANGQVLGVFDASLTEPMAEVLRKLGVERALVVHGMDGMDEFSVSDETKVTELKDGKIETYQVSPEMFGIMRHKIEALAGGVAAENAEIIKGILAGEKGAKRDIVLLNSGAALYVGKKADSIAEGVEIAKQLIDNKKALEKLEAYAAFTQSLEQ